MKTELSVIERASVALGASECEKQLNALVAASKDITIVTNAAGRDECHSSAMKATKARTGIAATGKDARDDANAFSKAVIAEEKRLIAIIEHEEIRLKALRDEWDNNIAAEKAEKERVEAERQSGIQLKIDTIRNYPALFAGYTHVQLEEILDFLADAEITEAIFSDRVDEAIFVRNQTVKQLEAMSDGKQAQEQLAAQVEAQRIENERAAAALAAQQAEAERVQREALKAEAERQRVQAEEIANQRAELEVIQRQLAEQQAEIDRQRVAAQVKAQLEAQNAQLTAKRNEAAILEQNRIAALKNFEELNRNDKERILRTVLGGVLAPLPIMPVEMVTIPKSEYSKLCDDSHILNCLRNAGVDNWEWFDDAMEEYHKESA